MGINFFIPPGKAMHYDKIRINGINIFYRESGDKSKPALVLLHGFPSASHMFRDLIPMLDDEFHIVSPDYPGFGQSDAPGSDEFSYTFENIAEHMDKFLSAVRINEFFMYVFDYGAPIGFRLANRHPGRILGIISQNGNVYEEGLGSK